MIPEWFADTVLISSFAYMVTGAVLLLVYALMRWRKVSLTFHHAAYFVGAFFFLGARSISFGLKQYPIHITYLALFFIAQGILLMILGYYKEKQSKGFKV